MNEALFNTIDKLSQMIHDLTDQRDEARRWAIRMKSQRDKSDNALYELHRSYCALRAENAHLRQELEIIRGENMSDLSRRIATIVISGVQPSHAPPEDGED